MHKVRLGWGEPFEILREFSLGDRVENPCVGGSIPPRATKKHQNHLRGGFFIGAGLLFRPSIQALPIGAGMY